MSFIVVQQIAQLVFTLVVVLPQWSLIQTNFHMDKFLFLFFAGVSTLVAEFMYLAATRHLSSTAAMACQHLPSDCFVSIIIDQCVESYGVKLKYLLVASSLYLIGEGFFILVDYTYDLETDTGADDASQYTLVREDGDLDDYDDDDDALERKLRQLEGDPEMGTVRERRLLRQAKRARGPGLGLDQGLDGGAESDGMGMGSGAPSEDESDSGLGPSSPTPNPRSGSGSNYNSDQEGRYRVDSVTSAVSERRITIRKLLSSKSIDTTDSGGGDNASVYRASRNTRTASSSHPNLSSLTHRQKEKVDAEFGLLGDDGAPNTLMPVLVGDLSDAERDGEFREGQQKSPYYVCFWVTVALIGGSVLGLFTILSSIGMTGEGCITDPGTALLVLQTGQTLGLPIVIFLFGFWDPLDMTPPSERVTGLKCLFNMNREETVVAFTVGCFISGGYAAFYYGVVAVPFAVANGLLASEVRTVTHKHIHK
jgi:hypothetical protein